MQYEQDSLEACPAIKLLEFPAIIIPVSPSIFFDHGGWCAMFTQKNSNFIKGRNISIFYLEVVELLLPLQHKH